MSDANPQVDGYIRKSGQWQGELRRLRAILLGCGLTEEVKWRVPCYTLDGRNVAFMGRFKTSCVLSFVQGSLLKDPRGILVQQTANSRSVRVIRFTSVAEIDAVAATVDAYLREAIGAERAGLKVALRPTSDFPVPEEFKARLDDSPALKAAFAALTPGRQRGYLLHFAGAKQSKTRAARVRKWTPHILGGKGIDDA